MTQLSDLGVLGLAVMGANLARNAARKGFGVALYNRHGGRTDDLVRDFGHEGRFTPTKDLKAFVAALAKPRVVLIMVQAGKPVDDVIDELLPYLEPDDIVIDGGNSLFTDTDRRFTSLQEKKIRFIGMGVSGGEEGALEGPSMMPGGERDAYARIEPMVTKMAAQVDGTPCCTYIGIGGDGPQRARSRRAADRDHRGRLCSRPVGTAGVARRGREEIAPPAEAGPQARSGRHRCDPRRALRLEDRRLRARLSADDGCLEGIR